MKKERERLAGLLGAIRRLKALGLHGIRVVGAYHSRRVAPIMARTLPLYQMGLGVDLCGSMMSPEVIHQTEIAHRVCEAFDPMHPDYLVLGHPMMPLEDGFVELVSIFLVLTSPS